MDQKKSIFAQNFGMKGPEVKKNKQTLFTVFKESALRSILSISRDVRMFVCLSHPGNHASRWIRDLWSKGLSLILAYL